MKNNVCILSEIPLYLLYVDTLKKFVGWLLSFNSYWDTLACKLPIGDHKCEIEVTSLFFLKHAQNRFFKVALNFEDKIP